MPHHEAPEIKEKIEEVIEHAGPWNKLLPLTTALIAVFAAIISSIGGNYASDSFLQKNNAIYYQDKATDQWNYYQAKGIKLSLAQNFYTETHNEQLKQDADRYATEQETIRKDAEQFERQAQGANTQAAQAQTKSEKIELATLLCQISIALSAMSALLKRKLLWGLSLILAVIALGIFIAGLL